MSPPPITLFAWMAGLNACSKRSWALLPSVAKERFSNSSQLPQRSTHESSKNFSFLIF
jgi:hypothetical protein